ncbi:MAG: hypothetical protein MN733_26130, partial [Nitrososphaera sp.]|nr:hypothetical protein [Nitrososphaera sp.]
RTGWTTCCNLTSSSATPHDKKRTGFWSGETLKERAKDLIDPYNEQCIDCSAYTLHMGEEYYTTSDQSRRTGESRTKVRLEANQPFFIPPGQFAFLLTAESVRVPSDAMAFISIRASYKFQGLINVSGFHVDPGYNDKLTFSVFNAGSSPVHLERGLDMFLIWYADLDRDSQYTRKDKPGHGTIGSELIKNMHNVLSLQSISDEIDDLKRQMAIQHRLFSWAVGIAGAIVLSFFFGMGFFLLRVHVQNVEGAPKVELGNEVATPLPKDHPETIPEVEATVEPPDQPASESDQESDAEQSEGPESESNQESKTETADEP